MFTTFRCFIGDCPLGFQIQRGMLEGASQFIWIIHGLQITNPFFRCTSKYYSGVFCSTLLVPFRSVPETPAGHVQGCKACLTMDDPPYKMVTISPGKGPASFLRSTVTSPHSPSRKGPSGPS